MLWLLSLMHLLVDGVCAVVMRGQIYPLFPEQSALLILVYNLLAFSTQGLTGLLADRLRRRELTVLSVALILAGLTLPAQTLGLALVKTALAGLGNSLFHVSGGAQVIISSPQKAWPLGIFVAPGALGLALGIVFPQLGFAFALLLCAACIALLLVRFDWEPEPVPRPDCGDAVKRGLLCAALLFCVFSRAFGGSVVSLPWKQGIPAAIITALCVVAGKLLGGALCDKFGAIALGAVSIPLAALALLFFSQWMIPSLAGQLLLNLSMPVTLWLLCRLLPNAPGFAFGLAASCLFPGTLFADMAPASGAVRVAIITAIFALNTLLVMLPAAYLRRSPPQHGEQEIIQTKQEVLS